MENNLFIPQSSLDSFLSSSTQVDSYELLPLSELNSIPSLITSELKDNPIIQSPIESKTDILSPIPTEIVPLVTSSLSISTVIDTSLSCSVSAPIDIIKKKRVGRPFPKGVSGNPGGKMKGLKSIPHGIDRALSKGKFDALISTIIEGAISGSDKKIDTIMKVGGHYKNENAEVTVNNNTLTLTPEMLQQVNDFIKGRNIDI